MKNIRYRKGRQGPGFYVDITIDGKRIRTFGGTTKEEARLELARLRIRNHEIRTGARKPIKQGVTLKELKGEFIKASEDKKAEKTLASYESSWNRVKDHFGEDRRILDITTKDIEDYMSRRRDQGVGPASVNREFFFLKAAFKKALRWGYLERNPTAGIERFKENGGKERVLTESEIKRLLEESGPRLRPVLIVLLSTGMRKSEALSLRWEDVDFRSGFITVRRSKSGRSRQVPMSSLVWETLMKLKESSPSEFVFLNRRTKTSVKEIRKSFVTACDEAKIKGLRIHDLRHTAITMMVEAGSDIVSVARIVGHSRLEMTARYCHPSAKTMRQAVENLGQNITQARQKVDTVEIQAPVSDLKYSN